MRVPVILRVYTSLLVPVAGCGRFWAGLVALENNENSKGSFLAPPPPAVRAGGAGGLVLPEETAAHASETLAYSGICVRDAHNSIRKAAFKGELSSGASVLRVSVQQFRAVLPSSSGAAPRAEHMARCGGGARPSRRRFGPTSSSAAAAAATATVAADGAADELVSPTSGRAGRARRWGMSGCAVWQGSGGEATARV